jgi:hypothetical protein
MLNLGASSTRTKRAFRGTTKRCATSARLGTSAWATSMSRLAGIDGRWPQHRGSSMPGRTSKWERERGGGCEGVGERHPIAVMARTASASAQGPARPSASLSRRAAVQL